MFLKWLSLHIFAIACVAGWQTFEFEPIQEGRYIGGGVHIDSSNVDSAIRCAELCISNAQCKAFSFECVIMTSAPAQGTCLLFDASVDTASELYQSSSMCYVQLKGYTSSFLVTQTTTSPLPTGDGNSYCLHNSLDYNGTRSTTKSGLTCQHWSVQSPHGHSNNAADRFPLDESVSAAQNYCRDPDGEGAPWCYTTNPDVSWDFCDIQMCSTTTTTGTTVTPLSTGTTAGSTTTTTDTTVTPLSTGTTAGDGNCLYNALDYNGTRSTTKSGLTCQHWSAQSPHRHTKNAADRFPLDESVSAAQNYCRDPDGEGAPWCYTTNPDVRWDFCDIQMCTTTTTTDTMVTSLSMGTTAAVSTKLASTPPTTSEATQATNLSNTDYIRDIIYGPRDMCSTGPSSQQDFIVINQDGVYVYDEVADLTVGPCKGPLEFTSVFGGYSDLTSVDQVSGLLLYQNSVELFSTALGKVFKWQIQSPSLSKQTTSLYYSALTNAITEVEGAIDFKWCTFRQYSTDERHFYIGNDQFFLKSTQDGNKQYTKNETVPNRNGFNMNPWREIPDNTVAACSYTNELNKHFVMIDRDLQVYTYHLDYNGNNNNPTPTVTSQGTIQFGGP